MIINQEQKKTFSDPEIIEIAQKYLDFHKPDGCGITAHHIDRDDVFEATYCIGVEILPNKTRSYTYMPCLLRSTIDMEDKDGIKVVFFEDPMMRPPTCIAARSVSELSNFQIVELVQKYLEPHQPQDYRLEVVPDLLKRYDDYCYLVVQPSREEISSNDYTWRISETETDIEDETGFSIFLTPEIRED